MSDKKWKPTHGDAYYIVSEYNPEHIYEYVLQGSKLDLGFYERRTLYPTREDARAAVNRGDFT